MIGSFDSSVHISEEASNAATAVPWAIVNAIGIAGVLGWGECVLSQSWTRHMLTVVNTFQPSTWHLHFAWDQTCSPSSTATSLWHKYSSIALGRGQPSPFGQSLLLCSRSPSPNPSEILILIFIIRYMMGSSMVLITLLAYSLPLYSLTKCSAAPRRQSTDLRVQPRLCAAFLVLAVPNEWLHGHPSQHGPIRRHPLDCAWTARLCR